MRAVLIAALATTVVFHTISALANQKYKSQDVNGQSILATQCSSSSNSTNFSHFAKCCRIYGEGNKFSGGVLVMPRGGGGVGGRGGRGKGWRCRGWGYSGLRDRDRRGKAAHDRRGSVFSGLSSQPARQPQSAPGLPVFQHAPGYPTTAAAHGQPVPEHDFLPKYYYVLGKAHQSNTPVPDNLNNMFHLYAAALTHPERPTATSEYYYYLGRQEEGGEPVPDNIRDKYYRTLSLLQGGRPVEPEVLAHYQQLIRGQASGRGQFPP